MAPDLSTIVDQIRLSFDATDEAREKALDVSRSIIRASAETIRAIHRGELDEARARLAESYDTVCRLQTDLREHRDIWAAGFVQDCLKEHCEASLLLHFVEESPLPTLEEIGLDAAAYINGMAEVVGELRRHVLDIIREGDFAKGQRMLDCMDDIFSVLTTLDYPDAVTRGLRRRTDQVRGILERTRGDLTTSCMQTELTTAVDRLYSRLVEGESAG